MTPGCTALEPIQMALRDHSPNYLPSVTWAPKPTSPSMALAPPTPASGSTSSRASPKVGCRNLIPSRTTRSAPLPCCSGHSCSPAAALARSTCTCCSAGSPTTPSTPSPAAIWATASPVKRASPSPPPMTPATPKPPPPATAHGASTSTMCRSIPPSPSPETFPRGSARHSPPATRAMACSVWCPPPTASRPRSKPRKPAPPRSSASGSPSPPPASPRSRSTTISAHPRCRSTRNRRPTKSSRPSAPIPAPTSSSKPTTPKSKDRSNARYPTPTVISSTR